MWCSTCDTEYAWDITVCPACHRGLQERASRPEPEPDAELVRVFVTGEAALIPLAKSLLEGENIEFMTRGENLQDLFGVGRVGTGFSPVAGPAEFWVRVADAERARALLNDLEG
jgi:hypothetical protein